MTNKIESMHSEMRNLHVLIRQYNRFHAKYSGRENWLVAWVFGDGDIAIYPAHGDTLLDGARIIKLIDALRINCYVTTEQHNNEEKPVIRCWM